MMPCEYITKIGTTKKCDLDAVFDLVAGYSKVRSGWSALIIFDPSAPAFIELCSSPQDYRGNSADEAEEVDELYIREAFGLSEEEIETFKANPKNWKFIDHR